MYRSLNIKFQISCNRELYFYLSVFQFSFLPFLYKCSQSSVWKIRELAVSAVLPFINDNMLVDHMNTIWENITLPMPENSIHGYLLQVRNLYSKLKLVYEFCFIFFL